jgi:tRNA threonylcarbamoyladenosine biosynthesis protein TsaE
VNATNTFISHNPAETESLSESWAREARMGWVIGLSGDLGAGKTQLVKGFARGLGHAGKVQSPTFALINKYKASLPLFHIDLYRLETREQIIAAGLEEYFYQPKGVAIIEWIERWLPELQTPNFKSQTSERFRLVKIEQLSENERRISYEDFGA